MLTQPVRTRSANSQPGLQVGGEDRRQQAVGRGVGQRRSPAPANRSRRPARSGRTSPRPRPARRPGRRSGSSAASTATVANPSARAPPLTTLAPRVTASPTCSSILAATGSLLTGPIVVASSNGSPSRIRSVDRARQQLDELVPHRAVHEDPLAGGAALARAQVAGGQRRLDRGLDVGVVHHHQRSVAAHLEQRRLARGRLRDEPAGRGRADERDAVGARVAGDLVADHRPRAR